MLFVKFLVHSFSSTYLSQKNRVVQNQGEGGTRGGSLAVKKLGNKGKKGKTFKAETIKRIMSPRSKYYCFNLSRASGTRNVYLVGQPWSPTIIINGSSTFKCILLALNRDGNYEMKIYVNT